MYNFIIFFWLCSIGVTDCQPIKVPQTSFVDLYDCITYGYRHSTQLLEKQFKRDEVNRMGLYTRFVCKEKTLGTKKEKDA
jgi:hypothetical protein